MVEPPRKAESMVFTDEPKRETATCQFKSGRELFFQIFLNVTIGPLQNLHQACAIQQVQRCALSGDINSDDNRLLAIKWRRAFGDLHF
jgi:hypothetical protein